MTKRPDPKPGDRTKLGRYTGSELAFLLAETGPQQDEATTTAIGNAALRGGLRALGSRVLDDVLALVLDSAIEVTGAERGFIMLANAHTGELEFKMARGRRQQMLSGTSFTNGVKFPEEVFRTGEPKTIVDLIDGGTVALAIRNVQCVPIRLVSDVERADAAGAPEEKRIGVVYLDSREKGSFLSKATRGALETLATDGAAAIENARLHRDTMDKAKMEQEK